MPRCCVIGAGPSGITAAKHLLQVGLRDVVVYDRNDRVGGNWVFDPAPSHSSVFETTHIISSKALSQYSDYPWPPGQADYPGHRELQAYLAVETSRVSATTAISLRRGYYFVPKFLFGLPSDVLHSKIAFVPRPLRARLLQLLLRLVTGGFERYALPVPDHTFLSSHPVVNSELLYFIRHGEIHPRPDISRFEARSVHFVDGRCEDYDAVIAATGFRISFPFLDRSLVDFSSGALPLYLRCFHPRLKSLFFIGLLQPIGCVWPLAELQGRLVANSIVGRYRLPADLESRIAAETRRTLRTYMPTPRHSTEVDYEPFRKALLREIPRNAPAWPAG